MTNPYDMIERLVAMQTVPMTPAEYRASQETTKDAVQVIGELIDQVDRLQAAVNEAIADYQDIIPALHWRQVDTTKYQQTLKQLEAAVGKESEADNG